MEPPDFEAAFKEHKKTRQTLLEKYRKTKKLYNKFTRDVRTNLELSHPSKSSSNLNKILKILNTYDLDVV
jgi:hypothetical protein